MSWQEQTSKRQKRSKTWQNDGDPDRFVLNATMASLHYEGVLDSGEYSEEVDFTPQRVDTAALDGWRVTNNGWHYAIGQPGDKSTDGWIGFGGRQGEHWFKFRLTRTGYLHWATRAWDDIGGAPDYDRANLSRENHAITFHDESNQVLSNTTNWTALWSTPGGGDISARWRAQSDGLKEEIILNQAGREWIAANRPPATPIAETFYGFVFEVDWSDVPRIYRQGVLQSTDDDFDDGDGAIVLRDDLARLLAFMPLDYVYVGDLDGVRHPLKKRFWKEDGKHYLLVGLRVDDLLGLPSGDLIFDPTIDEQTSASANDGYAQSGNSSLDTTNTSLFVGNHSVGAIGVRQAFARFTGISGLSGATINTSYSTLFFNTGDADVLCNVQAADAAAPAAPTTYAEFTGATLTTASVAWDGQSSTNVQDSPSLNSVFQEIADSHDPSTIVLYYLDDGTAATNNYSVRAYDWTGNVNGPEVYIDYTAGGGGGISIPVVMAHRRSQGVS